MRTTRSRITLARLGIGATIIAGVTLWSAAPASAHNYLVGSSPAADSVVTEQPGQITITTNDNLLDLDGSGSGMAIQVSGPDAGKQLYYGDGCVTVLGPTAETTAQLGQPGEYTVVWQVVSTDGHPVSGTYTFSWQPAAGQVLAEGSPTAPTCGREGAAPAQPSQAATDSPAPGLGQLADGVWIGAAALAAILAAGVTLLVVARRPPGPPSAPTRPDEPGPQNTPGAPTG